ncbi:cell division FtsA domain-containing protein [Lutispora saccharofermentans]|uniref:Rod shape-determining protein n=1 Tax=Lutispora saccharofermentans TaxID=3024236 RepID=A0ABT1NAW1_9FIRM|nr:cell division FtsA domain-containing protein [Lutispora saccharofermentans]MCQ1528392.1 rod shape-determining protein [Lutispora saccharofermentans]
MGKEEFYFSLDIGTRTVVGIVGAFRGEVFEIIDFEVEEHKKRAMYDGQIHDINLVKETVTNVKEKLEKRLNIKLDKVSIAAAGRSLKTCKIEVSRDMDPLTYIDKDIIASLEIEAIQKAQKEMMSMNAGENSEYYCVGYAVTNYFLNGTIIGKLDGHRGSSIGVEVIATFLPRTVIDSLQTVIRLSGLSIHNMTLEPIAAMNVAIQDNFKLLNIALVDVGAGTSDIALTKNGTIFAFAMVPTAGDEITEKIAEAYLLDFDTSEKVKLSLSKKSAIKFKDIMGVKHQVSADEVMKIAETAVKDLALEISQKIMEYNGKSPSAVFLIGGGSCIPLLADYIALNLELPKDRVGVRKTDIIKDVIFDGRRISGPEFITPIGIGVSARSVKKSDFIHVVVNDKPVKLLNTNGITVADVLIFIGFNPRLLIGPRGKDLHYELNGEKVVLKGQLGEPSAIFVNDMPSNINAEVFNGDIIKVQGAVGGKAARIQMKEIIKNTPRKAVSINGQEYELKVRAMVNGEIIDDSHEMKDGDVVRFKYTETVREILEELRIPKDSFHIFINDKNAFLDDKIKDGDRIEMKVK